MRYLIIFLFISSIIFGQAERDLFELDSLKQAGLSKTYFTTEKISSLILASMAGVFSSTADYYEYNKRHTSGSVMVEYDRKYHAWQAAERVSFVGVGISIALDDPKPLRVLSSALSSGSLFHLWHTITWNLKNNKPIFHRSNYQKEHNTSWTDKYIGGIWGCVGTIAVTFLIDYLVYLLME